MVYCPADLPLRSLLVPLAKAEDLLARLDERVRASPVRNGFVERQNFIDAAAALWLEGELVHLEDLVLHDARTDVRTPTHELTRAHTILRARRRIFGQKPDWALGRIGLQALRGRDDAGDPGDKNTAGKGREDQPANAANPRPAWLDHSGGGGAQDGELAAELAEIDALLARSEKVLNGEAIGASPRAGQKTADAGAARVKQERDALIFDPEWDEEERVAEWLAVVQQVHRDKKPAVLAAALAWESWESKEPLQHQAWLGNLLVAALLRESGKVGSHLLCLNAGLRAIPREKRRSPDRTTRLLAFLDAVAETASAGLKEIDRLVMAKSQMERRLRGRRKNSKLPALIELVLARPVVSAELIAKELKITPRAALDLVAQLGVREVTGRRRYRAWGVL